jgi:diadenosine tetraphosphate (Ap4A) HIT family hydrolase
MNDFSEEQLIKNCPHCDPNSFALKYPLKETENFWIVCDVHPLTKGHLLIIPKKHFSCVGEFPENIYDEFIALYKSCKAFINSVYGCVSSFEHGKIGQTVFHSHIHIFPFEGQEKDIIPEEEKFLNKIISISKLKSAYQIQGGYLFFSIADKMWLVDVQIGKPRFFRDRFAGAMHHPERGNWKEMQNNEKLIKEADADIYDLLEKWKKYWGKTK